MLDFLKKRFSSRDRLPDEIRTILQDQEMAGEGLVNYVRAIFAAFTLSTLLTVSSDAQTPQALLFFRVVMATWFAYAAGVWVLLGVKTSTMVGSST